MEYVHFCKQIRKPGEDIVKELSPIKAQLLHMAVGVSGESGELLDAIKKHTMYNKPLDMENVIEELGDIEFYLEGLRHDLGITREQTITHNIHKLSKRYPKGHFSNKQAQERLDKNENS